jgi:hypothetical protein
MSGPHRPITVTGCKRANVDLRAAVVVHPNAPSIVSRTSSEGWQTVTTQLLASGGYRFIPAVFQYSGGVVAEPGYSIERVTFRRPVPLATGFARIRSFIEARDRPLASFCACELRSPEPFTEAGFKAFNELYVGTLREWGIFDGRTNPVARSNVCPELHKPNEPSFHAFAFTAPAGEAAPSFCVAGSGECPEGQGNYRDHIVRRADVSPDGLAEKARWVLGEMERRLAALGACWSSTSAVQVYTVHDFHPLMARDILARGAAHAGLTWHYCRPPVVDIEYEMDCRSVAVEHVVD